MLLTGIGMFVLGAVKPCKGLHDGSNYFDYTCGDVCCQYDCDIANNKC
jgi:hypothetical protein